VDEALADPDLQAWLTKLRKQPPSILVPDLALQRAPRYRAEGPQLWSVRNLLVGTAPPSSARL
jgi:hypothetical protein